MRQREIPTSPQSSPGQAAVPAGLVSAVVELVNTGPVMLGAYTLAELTAVDAIVDFLEARPSDEVLAEAVRSLSARQLLVTGGMTGGRCRYAGISGSRWPSSSGRAWSSTPARPGLPPASPGGPC